MKRRGFLRALVATVAAVAAPEPVLDPAPVAPMLPPPEHIGSAFLEAKMREFDALYEQFADAIAIHVWGEANPLTTARET